MFELAWFSIKLFFQGKLLRDPLFFFKQVGSGIIISCLALITLTSIGFGLWLPMIISSFLGGIAMPFLLKDIKVGSIKNK